MNFKNYISRLGFGLLLALALFGGPGHPALPAGATTDPCSEVSDGPPIDEPEPAASGTVTDLSTSGPVQGATMELFVCRFGTGVSETTTTTNSGGGYTFSGITPGYYYFVQARMTGPLAGLQPAQGTDNPSSVFGVTTSVQGIDFDFE